MEVTERHVSARRTIDTREDENDDHTRGNGSRNFAAGSLAAVKAFESWESNYCCGGKRPLAEVCVQKGYNPAEVQRELETAMSAQGPAARDWNSAPLTELIDHIVGTHHEYLKREMPPLQARLDKVYRVYNERYGPTLTGLPEADGALRSELELHLRKEEMILFPAVAAYAAASESGLPLPRPHFGTVNNPIRMMETEHDSAGTALARIREITNNFEVPEDGCVTYRSRRRDFESSKKICTCTFTWRTMCCSRAQPRSKRLRVEYGRLMRIIQALLGEHGAMYPLLDLIEKTSGEASLDQLKTQAGLLRSTLVSHADLEDPLLRPAILAHLPPANGGPLITS